MTSDGNVAKDSLSSHFSEVAQLRSRVSSALARFPAYDTDYSLLRWLRNDNYDIEATAIKLESGLQILSSLGAFSNSVDSIETAPNALNSVTPGAKYFPGGIMSTDREGNVVCVQPMGRARPKNLMPTARVSDLYRTLILECEASMALIRKQEAERGHKVGAIIIMDLAEFGRDTVFMPAIRVYLNALGILQWLFPDSILKIYAINVPSAIDLLFRMVKGVLSKKTMERIEFLGSDWKEVLKRRIGEENMLPHWGGTLQSSSPTGLIRMGGEIPEQLRNELLSNVKRLPDEELTGLSISARRTAVLSVEVATAGSKLSWYFTVKSGDVDFWISCGTVEVWPRFRISTEFVAEYGEIECCRSGTYEVHLCNKHGMVWSKQIAFALYVDGKKVLSDPVYT